MSTMLLMSSRRVLSEPEDVACWTSVRDAMMYFWSHAKLVPDWNYETSSFSVENRALDKLA